VQEQKVISLKDYVTRYKNLQDSFGREVLNQKKSGMEKLFTANPN
tara:strand:- start:85 stop:219 length:135 start_codon:yes stop_codon:yes gene_type:complete